MTVLLALLAWLVVSVATALLVGRRLSHHITVTNPAHGGTK
jgi:hypothetical protein